MLRLILVPLDGSAFSAAALPAAAALAERHGATLHLVTVYTPMVVPLLLEGAPEFGAQFDEEQRDAHRRALTRWADRLRDEAGVSATWAVIDGDPAGALAAEVAAQRAGLVVLTTHGAGGFERAWLGSVADELVRRSPAPVLLVRPPDAGTRTGAMAPTALSPAALSPASDAETLPVRHGGDGYRFRRVLVPLDGSAIAEAILEPVLELTAAEETDYLLMRVVAVPRTAAPPESTFWTPREEEAIEQSRAAAREYLDGVAARLRAAGRRVDTAAVLDYDAARAVLREAESRRTELIAVSTHARAGFARLRLGSVADKVVRAAPCPTLVSCPRPEAAPRAPR